MECQRYMNGFRQDFHRVPKSLVSLVKHLHKSYFIIIKEMHDLILKLFHRALQAVHSFDFIQGFDRWFIFFQPRGSCILIKAEGMYLRFLCIMWHFPFFLTKSDVYLRHLLPLFLILLQGVCCHRSNAFLFGRKSLSIKMWIILIKKTQRNKTKPNPNPR